MKKKIFITLFLLIILISNISLASYSTVTMNVVEEPICTIDLADGSSFEKKLVSKNLLNKEVTIQLKIVAGEQILQPTGEIVLLLDNSLSMQDEIQTGIKRQDVIFNSAKTLVTNALKDNSNLKIAITSFSTNVDVNKEGTLEDAKVETSLTNNLDTLLSGIDSIATDGPRTDLDAGLQIATSQFSNENNNKYLIILTDGVPNVAVNYDGMPFSDDVISKTQASLANFKTNGINLITMLSGISDENASPLGNETTYKDIITSIFGTPENPSVGKFYYVTDTQAEKTIIEDIYNSLLPIKKDLTNITIKDYFPKEIIENFDFSYVSKASIGEISASIDKTDNSITWTIPKLESNTTATVEYKLKLKENFDSSIVDKLIDTNEKVSINYTDFDEKEQAKTSDVTPVLKLVEPIIPENLPTVLPKAGTTTLIAFFVIAIGSFIYAFVKLCILNKNLK